MINAITDFDFLILNFIQSTLTGSVADKVMIIASRLTDGGFLWLIIALILILIPKQRKNGLFLLLSLGLALIIGSFIIKPLVARARPFLSNEAFHLLITAPRDFSFPSGHTLTSFAAAVTLFRVHRAAGISALVFAALVAFSRMYLYVHFPSDVLVGLILGISIGVLTLFLARRVESNIKKTQGTT
ncbi:MAG: phosphatase PAP2 family protein [Clostridia bacterium]